MIGLGGMDMAKKFHTKKKKKRRFLVVKLILLVALTYLSFECTTYYILKSKLATSNEEFLQNMLRDSNHYLLYQKSEENMIAKIGKYFMHFDLSNPKSLLGMDTTVEEEQKVMAYQDDTTEAKFIQNPTPSEEVTGPLVYIYNSHQSENYSMKTLEPYNITPSVMMASYLMKEHFQKNGIETLVEETNLTQYLKDHNLNHAASYQVSREFVTEVLKKYPNLKLIIDLHRDAISHDASTITIGDKNYAKVLFIVGMNNPNYQANLDLATTLSNQINEAYPKLSRGVMQKTGSSVNGLYNQDLNQNMILLELGANENTIDEVQNTVEAITPIFSKYVNS